MGSSSTKIETPPPIQPSFQAPQMQNNIPKQDDEFSNMNDALTLIQDPSKISENPIQSMAIFKRAYDMMKGLSGGKRKKQYGKIKRRRLNRSNKKK